MLRLPIAAGREVIRYHSRVHVMGEGLEVGSCADRTDRISIEVMGKMEKLGVLALVMRSEEVECEYTIMCRPE